VQVDVGTGSVGEDGQVTFEATARATRMIIIDPTQLRALVKGRTVAEAQAALAQYGDVKVSLWPAWVSTVTGLDARLSISVVGQEGPAASSPSASPSGSVAP